MSVPRNRRRELRRLAQAARDRSKKPAAREAVEPIVEDGAIAEAPTAIGSRVGPPPESHASTVELPSIRPSRPRDPGEDTESPEDNAAASAAEPEVPERLRFLCPCGQPLTATRETYDRRMKCGGCGAILLVTLLLDPQLNTWRIEALRTGS